jgi:hypothetical protein
MTCGSRRYIVQQAGLVWAERGPPAIQRFIDTGSFGDEAQDDVEPYDQDLVKQIVATGRLC